MAKQTGLAIAMLLLAACRPSEPETRDSSPVSADTRAPASAPAIDQAVPPPAAVPAKPTSEAAAAQLVASYGRLLEQRRFAEARRLWGDDAPNEVEFAAAFDKYATLEANVGAPGNMEGAAGSIYVDVSLTLSGTLKSGGRYTISGPVTLRRVNDVPGSTAGQRRWHIYASDLKPAA